MKDTKVVGKTESGFDFTIDVRVIQDMEFLEMLGEVDANPLLMPKLCEKMLEKRRPESVHPIIDPGLGIDDDGHPVVDVGKHLGFIQLVIHIVGIKRLNRG